MRVWQSATADASCVLMAQWPLWPLLHGAQDKELPPCKCWNPSCPLASRPVSRVLIQPCAPAFPGHWSPPFFPLTHTQFQTWPQEAFESQPLVVPTCYSLLFLGSCCCHPALWAGPFPPWAKPKHLPRINQLKPLPWGLFLLRQSSSPFPPHAPSWWSLILDLVLTSCATSARPLSKTVPHLFGIQNDNMLHQWLWR